MVLRKPIMVQTNEVVKFCFSQNQKKEIAEFKKNLQNCEFAFTGSLLETNAYIEGLAEIVESINHT